LESYRTAAAVRADAPEPYARIGYTLWAFYLAECEDEPNLHLRRSPLRDCGDPYAPNHNRPLDPEIMRQTIAAWEAFEQRAPLDPRLSEGLNRAGSPESGGLLFERAILHTKLATKDHLQKAVDDYEKILHRTSHYNS